MKPILISAGLVWLIVAVIPPCSSRAQDTLTFSVPLIIAADEPTQTPQVRLSVNHTVPSGNYVTVDKYSAAIYGVGLPLGKQSGIEIAAQADRTNFAQQLKQWQPWKESDLMGTAGIWHQFSDQWITQLAFTRSSVHESSGFDGVSVRGSFSSYSAGVKYFSGDNWRAFAGIWVTPGVSGQSRASVGPVFGVAGKAGQKWEWLVGYPSSTLGFQLNRRIGLYSGVVFGGDLFNGEGVTGIPNVQDFRSYRETDVKIGVVWAVLKGWTIDAGLSYPLFQKFGPRP